MSEEEKREERIRRLTTSILYPLIVKMAVPSMIGMMVATVYNMTDTFWVGKLDNETYTASVGVVFAFVSVIQAIGFWFGYGSGNYISRMFGKKDYKEAERMAAIGVSVAIITGILILASGFIFIKPLIEILGGTTSAELAAATESYLKITICTVPFMLFSNVIYNQLRLSGAAKSSMIGLLVGMVINMVLDPIFILKFNMGVAGAAYASLIGQAAGCVMLYKQTGRNGNVAIRAGYFKPDIYHVKEILAGGAPNFCRQGITSISSVVLNNTAGIYGVSAIAAVTISQRVAYIAYALVIGFGQGFQPVCAINYGAGKRDRVRKAFKLTWITVTVFLAAATPILLIFADKLTGAFANQQDVIETASKMLKVQCVILPFMGYYILSGMMLQNIGRFGLATSVTIAENGTVFIPVLLVCSYLWKLDGIILSKPIASGLSLIYSIIIGSYAWKKYLCEEKRNEDEILKIV